MTFTVIGAYFVERQANDFSDSPWQSEDRSVAGHCELKIEKSDGEPSPHLTCISMRL